MSKKIAIVYFGLLRTLEKVHESHINNIYKILSENNIEYKIFVHTWKTKNDEQKIWDKTINVKQNYKQIELLNSYKNKIDDQEIFEKDLKFSDYFYKDIFDSQGSNHSKNNGEWIPQLIKNHLCALESLKRGYNMVETDEIDFDYVMFIRPDALLEHKFPINTMDFLDKNENGILVPNFGNHTGVNDRFAVTNYKYSKFYATRINELAEFRKNHGKILSEKYTGYIINKYFNKHIIDFKFTCLRP
jgi:hypothetical protein